MMRVVFMIYGERLSHPLGVLSRLTLSAPRSTGVTRMSGCWYSVMALAALSLRGIIPFTV